MNKLNVEVDEERNMEFERNFSQSPPNSASRKEMGLPHTAASNDISLTYEEVFTTQEYYEKKSYREECITIIDNLRMNRSAPSESGGWKPYELTHYSQETQIQNTHIQGHPGNGNDAGDRMNRRNVRIVQMTWEKRIGGYVYRSPHNTRRPSPPQRKTWFWRRVLKRVVIISCNVFKLKVPTSVQYGQQQYCIGASMKRAIIAPCKPRKACIKEQFENLFINWLQMFCHIYSLVAMRNWWTCMQSLMNTVVFFLT